MRPFALVGPILLLCAAAISGQSQGALDAADKLVAMQRYHEAIEAITQFLIKMPDEPAALAILGKAQFHLARFEEAKKTFEKCRRIDPQRMEVWTAPFLARLEFWYGHDEKAREYLAQTESSEFVATELPLLLDPPGLKPTAAKHYVIYVDAALEERGAGRAAADRMEQVHAIYSRVLPFDAPGIYNRVYLFSDDAKFIEFLTRLRGNSPGPVRSWYSENNRAIFINADPQGAPTDEHGLSELVFGSMFYSGFSQFRHLHVEALPSWFEKGMASYFGECRVKGGKLDVGEFIRKDPRGVAYLCRYEIVKKCIADDAFLPLSALLTISNEDFNDSTNRRSLINAAHAWSFVHYLLHAPAMRTKGKRLLGTYFTMMSKGSSREDAFAQTFGKLDLKKMHGDWLDYVKGL